jgi:murein DD-endopeptidase MepM/ murein hydrolase activator NlpD
MLISAGNGTTVQSAYLGQVTKVTSDNTYGNMVTMYLGNNYSVVYGQLDAVYVKEGDFVKEGASVGTIGNPTDSFSQEGSHLFFQMYDGDEPIDPVLFME